MRVSMKDGHLPGGASVSCTFHLLFSRINHVFVVPVYVAFGRVVLETTCRPTLQDKATAS